ncbi:MAG TPA: hypothetical protein PKZ35_13460 [Gammaproteobacteria bacterium]|nr:hypothetical protein [Gammaproteobacteria bacterium]
MYTPNSYINRLSGRGAIGDRQPRRAAQILDAFFDQTDSSVRSFREAYIAITGDKRVTGRVENCDGVCLREAVGTGTWANALGDAIGRRMVREYKQSDYNLWHDIADVAPPIRDFRIQRRSRIGGYGNLPTVNEDAAYPALVSPGEETATYSLTKRGGTETVSLETIASDDVGAIQAIPKKLALAAARTLQEFVLDHIKTNAAIYDGVTLFHASHGNLGSAALSAAAVAAGRAAMRRQKEFGSNTPLLLAPAVLWVPVDLEETAYNLFQRGTNNDRTLVESLQLKINVVHDWSDTDDWAMSASIDKHPGFEIGFFNGNEVPELFLQDVPTTGSLFSNDQLVYKIRHIYSGAVTDFRPYYKGVPA